MLTKFSREATQETSDQYVEYYQKAQKIDFLRVLWRFVILSIVLYVTNAGFVTWIAIWVWAIIVTFSSFIISLLFYFFLMSEYKVGQTVKIGDKRQGEIISIKPLYLGLSGKTETGEHTGEFFLIPNKMVRENTITKIDLKKKAIKKVSLDIVFNAEKFTIPYEQFITKLKAYLREIVPTSTPTTVGFYKSFIGYRYKIDVDYDKDGHVIVHLTFLDTLLNYRKTKQKIVQFVESLRPLSAC